MLDRESQRGHPAERVAHDVDRLRDQLRDVIGQRLGAQRAARVGRAAVAGEVDGGHAPLGQRGQDRLELVARAQAAVQEQQRLAGAVLGGAERHADSSATISAAGFTSVTAPADRPA